MKILFDVSLCCFFAFGCNQAQQLNSSPRITQNLRSKDKFNLLLHQESNPKQQTRVNVWSNSEPKFLINSLRSRKQPSKKSLVVQLAAHTQRILLSINCRRAKRFLTTAQRCGTIQSTPFKQMRFYLAPPKPNTLYSVILPDGKLKDSTNHHAVAVLDPFPNVGFGHLVFVFYVDEIPKPSCDKKRGLTIGPLLCLTLARRSKCKKLYRSRLSSDEIARKCEVNFLPLVYSKLQHSKSRIQTLQCYSHVAGFGKCAKPPKTRTPESCELQQNSHDCHSQQKSSQNIENLSICHSFTTCDRGVLILGDWTNLTYHPERERNLLSMYKMLIKNGYQKNKIQLFYGENQSATVHKHFQYNNAISKHSVRRNIFGLCKADLCVDTLVIYLNGPTLADGSIWLKDFNLNGVFKFGRNLPAHIRNCFGILHKEAWRNFDLLNYTFRKLVQYSMLNADLHIVQECGDHQLILIEEIEVYRAEELFDDVSNCAANHVIIFADQSYSGMLKTKLRHLLRGNIEAWNHVVLLTSGDDFDYSWYRGATEHWRNLTPKRSVSWAFENLETLYSKPTLTSRRRAEDHTIYGAPLSRHHDDNIKWKNVKRQYMGCQNIPIPKWVPQISKK